MPSFYHVTILGLPSAGKRSLMGRLTGKKAFSDEHDYITDSVSIEEKSQDGLYYYCYDLKEAPFLRTRQNDTAYSDTKDAIILALDTSQDYKQQIALFKTCEFPQSGLDYIIVKTKTDGAPDASIPDDKTILADFKNMNVAHDVIMNCSAKDDKGIPELKAAIVTIAKAKIANDQAYQTRLGLQIAAFKKIYTAMREGESGWPKSNFLTTIEKAEKDKKDSSEILKLIRSYTQDHKGSRTEAAWNLTQIHWNNVTPQNETLFRVIYKWSFAHSGWFKKSNIIPGTFFLSSSGLEPQSQEIKPDPAMEHRNTRSGKIYRALNKK